jgi:hypothetical protein
MSATPRSARLSSNSEVVTILVASAVVWVALIAVLLTLFLTVLIPTLQYGGSDQIPGDFPVYPGAQLESAVATSISGCVSVEAVWSTPDGAAAVLAFYKDRLATGGWTITGTGNDAIDFQSVSAPPRRGTVYIRGNQAASSTVIDMTMTKSPDRSNVNCLSGRVG